MMMNKFMTKALAIATGAVMLAGTLVAGVGAPATQVHAADAATTQAIRNMFDASFYANKYPDVKNTYGTNQNALFNHFLAHGMGEGRMPNANFDPKAYCSAYSDVSNYCNGDYAKACEHYAVYGKNENRNLTTFALLSAFSNGNSNYGWNWGNKGNATENWLRNTYEGDTWLWAYYDMYGSFPSWINNDNGQWDERLLEAYIDYYGTLPGQKYYNGWDWNWWNTDDEDNDWDWNWNNWNNPWLYGGYSGYGWF